MRSWLVGMSLVLAGCSQPKPIKASWASQLGQVVVTSQAPLQVVLAGFDAQGKCLKVVDQTISGQVQAKASFTPGSKVFICMRHSAAKQFDFDFHQVRAGDAKATSRFYQQLSDWRANSVAQGDRGGQPATEVGAHRPTTANPANPPMAKKSADANTQEAAAVPSARAPKAPMDWHHVTVSAGQPNVQLYEP